MMPLDPSDPRHNRIQPSLERLATDLDITLDDLELMEGEKVEEENFFETIESLYEHYREIWLDRGFKEG